MFKWIVIVILSFFFISTNNRTSVSNEISPLEDSLKIEIVKIENKEKIINLDKYFTRLNDLRGFNGNVLIAKNGQILYKKSFGYSNFKTKEKLKLNSTFQIASVSKQFTAVAILKLKEKGLLSLDDTVQKFFPNFPYKDITVRLLLIHKSGLPNYIYFTDNLLNDKMTAITNSDVMSLFEKHKPQRYYPANKLFDYSNTGYMVLASIIEKVSGVDFDVFMKNEIFEPLSMNNTVVYNKSKRTKVPNKTTGYLYYKKEAEDNFLNGVVGDKGIYSSVEDLFKWERALYTDKILSQEILKEAFKPAYNYRKGRKNYGFGWRMYEDENDKKIIYHGGWWQGYQSLLMRVPEDQITVIVLKNKKTSILVKRDEIMDILNPNEKSVDKDDDLSIVSNM